MDGSDKGTDYIRRADEEVSTLEKALRLIPGYRGYSKKEKLRDTDKLVRETLYETLRKAGRQLSATFEMLVTYDRDYRDVDRINLALDTFSSKVRSAPHGYSGLFDPVKVDEDALERLVSFDVSLFEDAQALVEVSTRIRDATKKEGDTLELSREASDLLDRLIERFDTRTSFMLELPE